MPEVAQHANLLGFYEKMHMNNNFIDPDYNKCSNRSPSALTHALILFIKLSFTLLRVSVLILTFISYLIFQIIKSTWTILVNNRFKMSRKKKVKRR